MTKTDWIKKLDQLDTDLNSFYEDLNISCDLYSAVDEFQRALCDLINQLEEEEEPKC